MFDDKILIVPFFSLSSILGLSLAGTYARYDTLSAELFDFANLLFSAIALLSLFGIVGLFVSARWWQVKESKSIDKEGDIRLQD